MPLKSEKSFYITTPIFYPNANLHMGHAYTAVISDIFSRYHKLKGEQTYFLTGSDENTQKVVEASLKAGKNPKDFLNEIVLNFKNLFSKLNISYDQFIRTSDEIVHFPGAIKLWQALVSSGDIYKKKYEGLYCVGHESFMTEKDLVDGMCPDHKMTPEKIQEENYFFRLSRYNQILKEKIESDELKIVPNGRKNEIMSLLNDGLEDVSFSRSRKVSSVGIPVPGDSDQIMYVWCDALSNYISALGYGREDDSLFKKFWPANLHVVGKDILRFHTAIWPAMLLSAGIPLPQTILAHGLITSGGRKMSKTLGNVIDPIELLNEYGADAVRYYLARHISPFEDGDLTKEAFLDAYNASLANGIGNLASRILKMAVSYEAFPDFSQSEDNQLPEEYKRLMEEYQVNKAADFVWEKIQGLDLFIQKEEPFKVFKGNPEKARQDVSYLVSELWNIAFLLGPFLPETSEKIKSAIKDKKMIESLFIRK